MRFRTLLLIFVLGLLLPTLVFAGKFSNTVVFGGLGYGSYGAASNNIPFVYSSYETDNLVQQSEDNKLSYVFGIQHIFPVNIPGFYCFINNVTLGPVLYYNPGVFNGQVQQNAQSNLTNYTYRLEADPVNLYLESDLNFQSFANHKLTPYLILGVGSSFDTLDLDETVIPQSGISSSGEAHLSNARTTNFVFELGAGMEYDFKPNWYMAARYTYQNMGTATADASGIYGSQTLNQTVNADLNSNNGYLILGYRFD